jgi:predicted metal-dependent phosphoesterase TrpH
MSTAQVSNFDFHVHSHNSDDCWMRPREIVERAQARGLSGIAVTDHNTIAGGLECRAVAPPGLLVLVGAEIATDVGDIVGLCLSKEIRSRDPLEVIHLIHQQGGVAFLPHPLRGHPTIPDEVLDALDGYEALNSRCSWFTPATVEGSTRWTRLLSKAPLGCSDAHLQSEIGNAYTMLDGRPTDATVLEQIRNGHTSARGQRGPALNFYRSQLIKLLKTRDLGMLRRFARRALRRAVRSARRHV